jgi:diguanylate cyclase (GGDEF)-like protein
MILKQLKYNSAAKWALSMCAALLVTTAAIEVSLEHYFKAYELRNQQRQVTQQTNLYAAELAGLINNNLSLISGLSAHIGQNPNISQAEFNNYANTVFAQSPLLKRVTAAPNLIIRYIYPLSGNETALGVNYRDHPQQLNDINTLTQRGTVVVTGPITLQQGGEALVARVAVFTRQHDFWGVVSAPMLTDELFRAAGLLKDDLSIEVAIRKSSNRASPPKATVIFGSADVFQDPNSITNSFTVGNTHWEMAARPHHGWHQTNRTVWVLRGALVVIIVMLCAFIFSRYQKMRSDLHYQNMLQKNEALLTEAGKLALVGGWQLSPHNKHLVFTLWSEQTAKIFGLSQADGPPTPEQLLSKFNSQQARTLQRLVTDACRGNAFDIELFFINSAKQKVWVRIIGKPLLEGSTPYSVLGSVQDITERKHFTNKIQQQLIYDHLTGLPNRLLFQSQLTKAIDKARRQQHKLALLFIDLDNFKPVNDNLGHSVGDRLLKTVGSRIKQCLRPQDTIARYSGDEFIVVLHDIKNTKIAVSVAASIIKSVSQVYSINDHQIFCGASVGISVYPDDGDNVESLVSKADQAMYSVKRSGRNGWQFFTKNMQIHSEKRHLLSTQLVNALDNNELCVYYQPIVDLMSSAVCKCEALVRWFKDGQQIPTDEFISLAEETGRINEIDRFVLATATEFLTELAQHTPQPIALSINVSPRVFYSKDDALDRWLALVTQASEHLHITVEITERLLLEKSDRFIWVLTKLKALGVTIAIDDFGTGYSSLSYLTKFPIDIIKIDQSFIDKLGQENTPEALTETMIELSHRLNLEVIAEGIETAEQLQYLQKWHCDYGQGYYFSKPLPSNLFTALVTRQQP